MTILERVRVLFPREESVPLEHRIQPPVKQTQYLVNGELRDWEGPCGEVRSPVCLESGEGISRPFLGMYPLLTEKEALEGLEAARGAYDYGRGPWPTMSVADRIGHVEEFVFHMTERREQIVRLLMWEVGKSLQDSQKEFQRTVEYIRNTIDALKDLDRASSRFVIEQGIIGQIRRGPLGVVLCMGPFNYPLNETFTTLIPALIMGNTVVLKPPKHGVLLYGPLLEGFRSCFPRGVVNVIFGEGRRMIPPLMASGGVDVFAFIGSSGAADQLRRNHPKPHRLRCVLGLEAKNPAIVLPEADLDLTVRECLLGGLSFNGQRCTALKLFFVHADIVDVFLEKLAEAIGDLSMGMPWEPDVFLTPLPEAGKPEYLTDLVEDACARGAKVMNEAGGTVNRSFVYPALLYPVTPDMRVFREEQFGPVLPVLRFEDIRTPVEYVIQSDYGQQLSIFGTNPEVIARLIDPLVNQVCRLNLNSQCQRGPDTFPFTGRKDSAEGTLSVSDALRVFSIRTLVAAGNLETNRRIITGIVRGRRSKFLSTDFIF